MKTLIPIFMLFSAVTERWGGQLVFGMRKLAKDAEADAIISDECDIAMPVVAELGKRLGLPTLSCTDATLYMDKYLMREFCKEHGLKSTEYCLCYTEEQALRFFRDLGKPMILQFDLSIKTEQLC